MPDTIKPAFLVAPESDPVAVRIEGRASFQNSATLCDFFNALVAKGKTRFVVDFHHCTSMDSTFLGVIAGLALQLRKQTPPGSLVLCRLGERNLELVRNLGLHRLLIIDTGDSVPTAAGLEHAGKMLDPGAKLDELANARLVLAAHENLVAADEANREKFQDVLGYLQDRLAKG